MKKARAEARASSIRFAKPLELVRNVIECVAELRSDAGQRGNGGDGDERRDQAIFDGGRAALVADELEKITHEHSP